MQALVTVLCVIKLFDQFYNKPEFFFSLKYYYFLKMGEHNRNGNLFKHIHRKIIFFFFAKHCP